MRSYVFTLKTFIFLMRLSFFLLRSDNLKGGSAAVTGILIDGQKLVGALMLETQAEWCLRTALRISSWLITNQASRRKI